MQHQCITEALVGNDLVCQSLSGMGKTVVFVLAVLHQIDADSTLPQCVVLCHTRELAYQICAEFERFSKHMAIKTSVLYGGIPKSASIRILKNEMPLIVVGTPGRLKSLVESGDLDVSHVRYFVMDEADILLQHLGM